MHPGPNQGPSPCVDATLTLTRTALLSATADRLVYSIVLVNMLESC